MLICPNCSRALRRIRGKFGLFWSCPLCHGKAMTLAVLRKAVPRYMANRLWQGARAGLQAEGRCCPACKSNMAEVPVPVDGAPRHLDLCTRCHFVWFDSGQFEDLPRKTPPQPDDQEAAGDAALVAALSEEGRKALALARLEAVKQQQTGRQADELMPERSWHLMLAFCGVPVEYNDVPLTHRPWVTWLAAAVIAAVSLLSFRDLPTVVVQWGLVPAAFGRHLGLTFVTSFFLHAGVVHLLGNLYFLWVFGDNTEDVLGKGRYVLLIALAALAGDVLHIVSDPQSTVPMIGASGGISGILAYYCLRFPRASIGVFLYFRWVRLPAWAMLAVWLLLQMLYAFQQRMGLSRVAAFAHLGGAAVGVLFWGVTHYSVARGASSQS